MAESRTEVMLKSPPDDKISSVQFGPNNAKFLLVSSWDGTVRLYNVESAAQSLLYGNHNNMPVLDICFQVKSSTYDACTYMHMMPAPSFQYQRCKDQNYHKRLDP
jgi:WD40 repeat protein